ncbi:hypothetical protein P9683_14010 [Priestia megaterium]|nr:hypothetical protein [Priestia megaterium]
MSLGQLVKKYFPEIFFAIFVCGSGWDYVKKIGGGFSTNQVSFNETPMTEMGVFIFSDTFWIFVLIYLAMKFLFPIIIKKIRHISARLKKIKKFIKNVIKKLIDHFDDNQDLKG